MKTLQSEVLVIGGGATGTGVARDLAMRGFETILVEKSDLTTGTTGRYHGLLHSGGRYVVKDPQAAAECIQENRILRRIMPFCLEDTGGFFVITPDDDPKYAPRFLDGCKAAGVPVEELPIQDMLREEPLLNPAISRCFRVPDAAADSFLAADANAESARLYGARTLVYRQVLDLTLESGKIKGARCQDLVRDEEVHILADMVVNASGAWAGKIAASAGIEIQIIPGKGTMIAANHRIVNTVINRCKMPGDGDILVPIHTVSVIGTTDIPVEDPDHFAIQPWEIELMLAEGEKIIPGFKQMRMLRAWAGVRPLYRESTVKDSRDISRSYVLLDHEERDGVSGLVTITSGKWTTYRQMAEVTVDLVCRKLGTVRECRTHLEPLPKPRYLGQAKPEIGRGYPSNREVLRPTEGQARNSDAPPHYHQLGLPLSKIEERGVYGDLICECELAETVDVEHAIQAGAQTIDDVRRDVRLGMGPCQGGFCTYRVTGMLYGHNNPSIELTNVKLRDFLQERWKGLLPILWGQQLRQERLNTLIYHSLFNVDQLPGPKSSPLGPEMYVEPSEKGPDNLSRPTPTQHEKQDKNHAQARSTKASSATPLDVIVIGAGLAGLTAAWQATLQGKKVYLLTQGWGATHWHAGCIDVLGDHTSRDISLEVSIREALRRFIDSNPDHPYATAGLTALEDALEAFKDLCVEAGYPVKGSLDHNWLLPSALGASRPTCLVPETMLAGDLGSPEPMLVIGFERFRDFYPELIASNLTAQGIPAQSTSLDLPRLQLQRSVTGRVLAGLFEELPFRAEVADAIRSRLQKGDMEPNPARIGFPAVLGLEDALSVKSDLEEKLQIPVFEIPTLPPSIPGIRLSRILVHAIEEHGGRVFDGMQVVAAESVAGQVTRVWSEAAARRKGNRAKEYILATGEFLGGGLYCHPGEGPREMIFDLPVTSPPHSEAAFRQDFITSEGHPLFRSGVVVNSQFQPVDGDGQPIYGNLTIAGSLLANCDVLRERSLEGVALVTGYLAGRRTAY